MDLPKVVYKYRNWDDLYHKRILTENEIYLASPQDFNDPFDCGITHDLTLMDESEREEYKKSLLISRILTDGYNNLEFINKKLDERFSNLTELQNDYDQLHSIMQNNHFGIFSCSSTWRSIQMWSHYANCHKGFCVGLDNTKLINYFGKGGKVQYERGYPKIKPKAVRFDEEFMIKSFRETHVKSFAWKYEHEFRLMKTLYPDNLTPEMRKVIISDDIITEIILGISIPPIAQTEIMGLCKKKNIRVFQACKIPHSFAITRNVLL